MKKVLCTVLALAMALALLAGCGGAPASSGSTAASGSAGNAENATIKVAALVSGYENTYPGMWQEVCDAFTAQTGINVELTLEQNLEDVLNASMQGGDYPDVIHLATGRPAGLTEQFINGKMIADITDVLDMTVEEACVFFANIPKIARKLQTLQEVGLGYIQLGQAATTLSGGEAQRVKLANELARRDTGQTVYILDEPTTGLHVADVHRLVKGLDKLVDAGNTVIIIEHNLDVIKRADYIIDLGPEGGSGGGTVVATGTPEEVAENPNSFTGQYLKPMLARAKELQEKAK